MKFSQKLYSVSFVSPDRFKEKLNPKSSNLLQAKKSRHGSDNNSTQKTEVRQQISELSASLLDKVTTLLRSLEEHLKEPIDDLQKHEIQAHDDQELAGKF